MPETIFLIIALATVIFAVLTVSSRDVFHSAVYLAMTLMSVAGIYFYLGAQFLGVIQILVYIGGIITLFVFAIKLTAQIGDRSIRQVNNQLLVGGLASLFLLLALLTMIKTHPWAPGTINAAPTSLQTVGTAFLTKYVLVFEYISVVLLSIMIGAIVIGKGKK